MPSAIVNSIAFLFLKLENKMNRKNVCKVLVTATIVAAAFATAGIANATIISTGGFTSPTMIDFETAPPGLINATYSGLGVTFTNLSGGQYYNTGNGYSYTASNFYDMPGFPDGITTFAAPVQRAGFDITTNAGDNTVVSAYLGASLVGSEYFITSGSGGSGSFAGVEFLSGFDSLVIHTEHNINGAFAMDNFRFEGNAVPVPAAAWLLGSGLLGLIGVARRKVA